MDLIQLHGTLLSSNEVHEALIHSRFNECKSFCINQDNFPQEYNYLLHVIIKKLHITNNKKVQARHNTVNTLLEILMIQKNIHIN